MSYLYTNTAPQPVKQLDPDLPLIRMDVFAQFTARKEDGKLYDGRIHPQRLNKDSKTSHPSLFYAEFPAGSADYREVSIPKLNRILGEGGGQSFTLTQAARFLSAIPRRHHFLNLITSARP